MLPPVPLRLEHLLGPERFTPTYLYIFVFILYFAPYFAVSIITLPGRCASSPCTLCISDKDQGTYSWGPRDMLAPTNVLSFAPPPAPNYRFASPIVPEMLGQFWCPLAKNWLCGIFRHVVSSEPKEGFYCFSIINLFFLLEQWFFWAVKQMNTPQIARALHVAAEWERCEG